MFSGGSDVICAVRSSQLAKVAIALIGLAPSGVSQVCPRQQLNAPIPVPSDGYGQDVSVDGDRLAISTTKTSIQTSEIGYVNIYELVQDRWIETATISPPDPAVAGSFGHEVELLGDTLAVFDPDVDRPGGAVGEVYLYEESGGNWSLTRTLVDAGGQVRLTTEDLFYSLPWSPDGSGVGEVHIYDRSTWTRTTLHPPQPLLIPNTIPLFGSHLTVDGGTLVATIPFFGIDGAPPTRFVVYEKSGGAWSNSTHLIPGGSFGKAEIDGGNLVCKTYQRQTTTQAGYGRLFFYRRGGIGWDLIQEEGQPGDPIVFTHSVSGGHAAVTAPPGTVQVWEYGDGFWSHTENFQSPPLAGGQTDVLGVALDMQAGSLFAANEPHYLLEMPYSVYELRLGPHGTTTCSTTPNSTGAAARISSVGCPSVAANELTLRAVPVPDMPGLFFYGRQTTQIPFGDGTRCVGGKVRRLPIAQPVSNVLTWNLDLNSPSVSGMEITDGSTWYFQAWFRDPRAGGAGFNLSDARRIEFWP